MSELENRIVKLCIQGKSDSSGLRYEKVSQQIEEEFGERISAENIRRVSRKYRFQNHLDENFNPITESKISKPVITSYNSDGSVTSERQFSLPHGTTVTPDVLLEKHGFDKDFFELVNAKNSQWNAQQKGGHIIDLYSSRITVRPTQNFVWSESNIQKIFDNISIPHSKPSRQINTSGDNLLVLPISDLHLGMLSEDKVTGNNYNLEIAESLYYQTIDDVIGEVDFSKISRILFIIGNDFINSDNINNTTTKGTQQDASNMWHTIVDKAVEMCINGIDKLAMYAPVDVVYAVSNHDYHTMYGIIKVLEAYYRNDDNIRVDSSALERKYYRFGKNLIGIAHNIKPERALELMSVEAHSEWSKCKSMIWFLGHLHTQMAYSKKGYVEILRLPTISGWSRWSSQQGFTQTERKNQAFIINPETGIRTIINTVFKL